VEVTAAPVAVVSNAQAARERAKMTRRAQVIAFPSRRQRWLRRVLVWLRYGRLPAAEVG
jgi:hypothetical protein